MPNKKPSRFHAEVVHVPKLHGDLPTLPAAFSSTEYDGWLAERIKRFQLQTYQRTQAERVAVLKQINELQHQCLAIARNESDWQHYAQEDRLRQKRLDVQELELDMWMEELRERRAKARQPVVLHKPEPKDPIRDALNRLRNKLKTGVEARSECDRLKQEYPDYASEIEREFGKMLFDIREDV